MALPNFPFTRESSVASWSNYHGTIANRAIPLVVVPDIPSEIDPGAPSKFRRCGDALRAIVGYAIKNQKTLRVVGSRWSLSNVIEPGNILLDPAYLNKILKVRTDWLTDSYRTKRAAKGLVPVLAQGGTTIHDLNESLGNIGLALRTSGASDGHRIAGAIATGTHGSAIDVGAIHDTVLGMHLVVGSDKSVFVMPKKGRAMKDDVGQWLAAQTGIPTETVPDDELFAAAQVSLGSLGVVHAVVLEAEPLYRLRHQVIPFEWGDPKLREAIRTLDTRPLHPNRLARPFHFEVVFSPYPPLRGPGAYAILMWKEPGSPPPRSPPPRDPQLTTALFDFLAALNGAISGPLGGAAVETLVNRLLASQYKATDEEPRFPGEIFGTTRLPPGDGSSTEIAVAHADAPAMLDAVHQAVTAEARRGHHHLGAFGVRFFAGGRSLLGMNQAKTTTIEMGGIRTPDSMSIFTSTWNALDAAKIDFACHWGQLGGHEKPRIDRYYGANAVTWKKARDRILPKASRAVFASAILAKAGLK